MFGAATRMREYVEEVKEFLWNAVLSIKISSEAKSLT